MASTTRSFTVFVDAPASEEPEPKAIVTSRRLTRSLSESAISTFPTTTILSIVPPIDKENLDPLTGERVTSATALGKKRKGSISVLAVKPPTPPELKVLKEKVKDVAETRPETKKRRSSVSSSSSSPKKAKVSGSAKKGKRSSSRRPSPMPKLDEENESVTQAQIDSKCYDLTVKPLADVSEAFDLETESAVQEQDVFHFVKEASAEPEIRDYFPSLSLSSSSSATVRGSSPAEVKAFSTPERKQIYSAFTFTSPSPTSQRSPKLARSVSVPLIEFSKASY
ncbi:hypothetical protein BT96DRAFT_877145 [Gymnopus androsaceus JB14]|uniref:Uncharacterized protein n=1 Tax=Gymnopus androsaceus JB14 TaxID=1447944 RepID=A0A6A4I2Q1_9AGAR|nr:hypothetical protein BT96DRAFT_877145 [Gymnopus androsaceus JB14]